MGQPTDLEKLEKAAADLRELVQEAHGVTKDLRSAYRQCKSIFDGFEEMCQREYSGQFRQLMAAIDQHMREANGAISAQFERARREIFETTRDGDSAVSLGDLITAKRAIDYVLTKIAVNAVGGEAAIERIAQDMADQLRRDGTAKGINLEIVADRDQPLGDMSILLGGGEDSSG